MSNLLFFRPRYELATEYLYEWFGTAINLAQRLGYSVVDIPGEAATQENLLAALETYQFSALFLGGHGNPDTFTGQNSAVVFRACQNDEVLAGNIAYYLSCYDEKTEVLTKSGFKPFKSVWFDDLIATLNPEGYIEYHHPEAIQKYRYNGEMIHFDGKCYDLLVTPDHNMYCKRTYESNFKFISAEEVANSSHINIELKRDANWTGIDKKTFTLPKADPNRFSERKQELIRMYEIVMSLRGETGWGNKKISKITGINHGTIGSWIYDGRNPSNTCIKELKEIPIDDWLIFLGWYLTEGYTREKSDGAGEVTISQTKPEFREEIVENIKEIGFSPCALKEQITFHSRQLYDYLKYFGYSEDKFIPSWIKQLPVERLKLLFDVMMKGDSTKKTTTENWTTFYTKSKELADDFQEIILKSGNASTIGTDNRKDPPLYHVYVSYKQNTPQIVTEPEWINYEGFVYDVTVPNHVIYVRRNGKAVWCGNCFVGQELLPSNISKGLVAGVGYINDFRFMVNTDYPIVDNPVAEPFQALVVDTIHRMLTGHTIKQVWEGAVATGNRWIQELFNRPEPVWGDVIDFLQHDIDAMIALGNKEVYATRPIGVSAPLPLAVGAMGIGALMAWLV